MHSLEQRFASLIETSDAAQRVSLSPLSPQQQQQQQLRGGVPVSKSWLLWHVTFPKAVAVFTLATIVVYVLLVAVAMGVRVLRYQMNAWLAWFMLSVIALLLLLLGLFVAYNRLDVDALRSRLSRKT